jgi:hypothetical protein
VKSSAGTEIYSSSMRFVRQTLSSLMYIVITAHLDGSRMIEPQYHHIVRVRDSVDQGISGV